jgi:hypothetical protein
MNASEDARTGAGVRPALITTMTPVSVACVHAAGSMRDAVENRTSDRPIDRQPARCTNDADDHEETGSCGWCEGSGVYTHRLNVGPTRSMDADANGRSDVHSGTEVWSSKAAWLRQSGLGIRNDTNCPTRLCVETLVDASNRPDARRSVGGLSQRRISLTQSDNRTGVVNKKTSNESLGCLPWPRSHQVIPSTLLLLIVLKATKWTVSDRPI